LYLLEARSEAGAVCACFIEIPTGSGSGLFQNGEKFGESGWDVGLFVEDAGAEGIESELENPHFFGHSGVNKAETDFVVLAGLVVNPHDGGGAVVLAFRREEFEVDDIAFGEFLALFVDDSES